MNTTIRILIDENAGGVIAKELAKMSGINAVFVGDLSDLRGRSDDHVWSYAKKESRIVLSLDSDFSRFNHPVCTHHGIIRFKTRKYDPARVEAFKKFALSGHRVEARQSITYLYDDRFKIETCEGVYENKYE